MAKTPRRVLPSPTKRTGRTKISKAAPVKAGQNVSVGVEKISNGYLVKESSYGPNGQYKETVTFSKTPPNIKVVAK